jgi:uncharacterized protein YraI
MFKRFALAAAIALTTAGAALANPGWATQDLNFRTGPGTDYEVIAKLAGCTRMHVYESYGSWYKVQWNGYWGWVSARYVSGSDDHCYYAPAPRKYKKHKKTYTYQYNDDAY